MDIKENFGFEPNEVTIDSGSFEIEKVVEMFDDVVKKYRVALAKSHQHKNSVDNSAGIIILADDSKIELSTFGSGIKIQNAITKGLVAIAKSIAVDDVAAILIAVAAEMMLEAEKIGNFTFKSLLSLSLAKSFFADLEKAVIKSELKQ